MNNQKDEVLYCKFHLAFSFMMQYFHYFEASKHHHGSVICPIPLANCEYLQRGFMNKNYDQKYFKKYRFLSGYLEIWGFKVVVFSSKSYQKSGFCDDFSTFCITNVTLYSCGAFSINI